MEDGLSLKTLKRHLQAGYGMTADGAPCEAGPAGRPPPGRQGVRQATPQPWPARRARLAAGRPAGQPPQGAAEPI